MCDNNHRHYYQHQKKLLSLDYLHTKKMTTSSCELTWLIYKSAKKRIIRSHNRKGNCCNFFFFYFWDKIGLYFFTCEDCELSSSWKSVFLRTTTACWYYCHCGVIMLIMHDMMIITLFPPPYKHFLFVSAFYQHYHRKCIVTGNKTS